jgi:hypothetical protein
MRPARARREDVQRYVDNFAEMARGPTVLKMRPARARREDVQRYVDNFAEMARDLRR